jgi:RNA methyltransferase, TrmH family
MAQTGNRGRPKRSDDKAFARIAGFAAVAALFTAAPERVERLFFDARAKRKVTTFCAELTRTRRPYREVEPDELARLAGTAMHGGIVAIARPQPVLPFELARAYAWAAEGRPLLLLDGVGNPHNLGAIARTAAFFGLPRMVLSDNPAQAAPSDASYRVAEGGLDCIALYRAKRFAAALKGLRQSHRVIAASPGRHAVLSGLRRSDRPFALVLGNEETGLPRATLEACEEVVAIPGAGRVQSLNVAATAAILIYAVSFAGAER